jgi:flagellar hook protein FlgE
MYSGVSGLRSHQTMMDVIGNNISNVNTVGYKAGTAVFQDLLSQMVRGAATPIAGGAGGSNPAQIGLGVRLGGVANSFTQGASQVTNRATDLAIQGDGFLVVRSGQERLFTRAGSLDFDALGRLTTPGGGVLQGWIADQAGNVDTTTPVTDLSLPLGQVNAPLATQGITLGGNLSADTAVGDTLSAPITIYDGQGNAIEAMFDMTRTGADTWNVVATVPTTGGGTETFSQAIEWDGVGVPPQFDVSSMTFTPSAAVGQFAAPITVEWGDPTTGLTQFAGDNGLAALTQDGARLGSLQSFGIGEDGTVMGVFSNGRNRPIGRIALAGFGNPGGLEKVGGSMWRTTVNSGLAQVGPPGTNGRGTLQGSTLEMSNVDLAQEFTNLIVAQRGFQASSRVISASDEMLSDLVNLKR